MGMATEENPCGTLDMAVIGSGILGMTTTVMTFTGMGIDMGLTTTTRGI